MKKDIDLLMDEINREKFFGSNKLDIANSGVHNSDRRNYYDSNSLANV